MDDAALVERARRGDVSAYDALVRLHQRDAVRLAWLVGGDAGEADDVVQEAFVKAWGALGRSFRPGAPFRPWLLRIVANEARNRRRSRGRRASLALRAAAVPVGAPPSPEDAAVVASSRASVAAALDRLPEHERLVLACRYLLDLSEAETAVALDCPPGTVKSRASRGLARLRVDLGSAADD
jgi:RNA polymerase sigma-70 factor (ECF subfamily)